MKKPKKHGLMPASNINVVVCTKCNWTSVTGEKACPHNQAITDYEAWLAEAVGELEKSIEDRWYSKKGVLALFRQHLLGDKK